MIALQPVIRSKPFIQHCGDQPDEVPTLVERLKNRGVLIGTEAVSLRRITVVLVDRANYGRILPVLWALRDDPRIELSIVLAGTMVLERFGSPWKMLEADGLDQCVVEKVYHEVEGGNPQSRTLSSAALCAALAPVYARLAPDIVLLIGDRFEALGAATAAFLGGFCIAHIQGGEVSRTIDDTTRHAITKLAHYHFASTDRAALRIGRMGEVPEHVFWTGCPSSDLVSKIVRRTTCPGEVLCIYHPDEVSSEADIKRLFNLLKKVNRPVSYWWPNIDTGSDVISKILRQQNLPAGRIYKNLHPVDYLNWLSEAAVLVGNSSSFVREAGYFGIPTLLIGDRQNGRESHREVYPRTESVIDEHLLSALNTWKPSPGWAPSNSPYYHEGASAKIVSLLATLDSITTKTYYQGSI